MDEELLVSVCIGLIKVQHVNGVVGLVHFKAQIFLSAGPGNTSQKLSVRLYGLVFLISRSKYVIKDPTVTKELKADSGPLLRYAAKHRAEHTASKNAQSANPSVTLIIKFSSRRTDGPPSHQVVKPSANQPVNPLSREIINPSNRKLKRS